MRGGVTALVTALLLVLVLPSTGAAQTPLPVGEADGVRIVRDRGGGIVVVFTKRAERLRRRVAGKRVSVFCTEFTRFGGNGGGITQRAPRRGRRIETGDRTRGMDYCRVWLAARTVRRGGETRRRGRELIVSVPLTQDGAVHLDEESKALAMGLLLTASELAAQARNRDGFLSPAQLSQLVRMARPSARSLLVALAAPSDTPPAGSLGYYSDGAQHAAAVVVSASGKRLFLEYNGDVLHTNVAKYLFGRLD
jgi:hypothetical protein